MHEALPKLGPVQQKFISHRGELGAKRGIDRTVAQIHALLFISEQPLTQTIGSRPWVWRGRTSAAAWGNCKDGALCVGGTWWAASATTSRAWRMSGRCSAGCWTNGRSGRSIQWFHAARAGRVLREHHGVVWADPLVADDHVDQVRETRGQDSPAGGNQGRV